MQRHEKTLFRITTWPSNTVPLPSRMGGVKAYFEPALGAFLPEWGAYVGETPDFTGETYLKLAALDPDDPDCIAAFLSDYGELRVRDHSGLRLSWPTFGHPTDAEAEELETATLALIEEGAPPWAISADTLVEARWAILTMRDLIAAWRSLRGQLDAETHRWESPLWRYRTDALDSSPWAPEGPAWLLNVILGEGLTAFTPSVQAITFDRKPVGGPDAGDASMWNVCCLELFNHIVERADYKICANETCGRDFVRQEGRAEHGQYRTSGVKYCTSECARAQAQRAYRRRQRASEGRSS